MWTKEEEQYLLDRYFIDSTEDIAKHLGRSISSIHNKTNKMFKDNETRKSGWTKKEEQLLKDNYENMTLKELEILIGRSIRAIDKKLRGLGIDRNKSIEWSIEDDTFLEYNWGIMSIKRLAKHFGRSENSVKRRGYDKGYGSLYNSGYYITMQDIIKMLNVDYSTIINWIKKKKLTATRKQLSKLKTYMVKPENFYDFLEENQDLWNATKIDQFSFPISEEWFIEKLKKDDNLIKAKNNSPWTRKEEELLISLCMKGLSNKEMVPILNRTEYSIECKRKYLRRQDRLLPADEIKKVGGF